MTQRVPSVHRKNLLLLGLALAGVFPLGWDIVGAVALGGGIQILNLRALEQGLAGVLRLAEHGRSAGAHVLLMLRLALLLGVVGFVLLKTGVEPLAFMLGLFTAVPAVIWHGLEAARTASRGGA